MEKIRVYELAKELNTNSKILIDKLKAINIDVKNHMSVIEPEQLKAIYEYFGINIKAEKDESKKEVQPEDTAVKPEPKKVKKDVPRIIRTEVREIRTDLNTGITTEIRTEIRGGYRREIRTNIKTEPIKPQQKVDIFELEPPRKKAAESIVTRPQKTEDKKLELFVSKQEQKLSTETEVKDIRTTETENAKFEKTKNVKPQKPHYRKEQTPKDISKIDIFFRDNSVKLSKTEQSKETLRKNTKYGNKKPLYDSTKTLDLEKENLFENKRVLNKIDKKRSKELHKSKLNIFKGIEYKISDILNDEDIVLDYYDDQKSKIKVKKGSQRKSKETSKQELTKSEPVIVKPENIKIILPEVISIKELAEKLKKPTAEIIKKLLSYGVTASLNERIDYDTAAIIAEEFGFEVEKEVIITEEDILFDETEDKEEELEPRPPVVVVMGHVDHGKTSLLDAIRETNVTASEAGGITQHIGAYTVKVNNRSITFLDTPGHEAFTAMRARGAQVTDIAILVVAADDGVMPQTVEAINHAKAANVAIIVAINKIDKPEANPERVKQQLTEYGLIPEEWGGDTVCVQVSAKKREGINTLLEMILLVADMLDLKANPNKQAKGTVIEAKLDKGRGPVATVLVQRGTLKTGDTIITGTIMGKIRAMVDDKGQKIKKAKPSTPVEIIGLPDVPEAGEIFYVIKDEKVAKQLIEKRKRKQREETLKSTRVSLNDLFDQIQQGKVKELNVIIKADVQGSVEAIKQALEKISTDEVRIKVIHGGVGGITESDVMLASVSNAIIIGFNVRPEASAKATAEREKVDIRLYRVIYEAIDDISAAIKGLLEPKFKEVVLGHAEVRQLFKISGIGTVAGCYVTDGKITRNSNVRLIRNNIVVFDGKLASLKRFKDDVKEVAAGFECGMGLEKFNDIKEGDIIESYIMEQVVDG